ncbi:MAG: hypothetical protein Q4A31_09365 [Corynebacterium sp.]|uniref:hypothetical protein n=1 Tax=Corynebacterium sp. TaxID=1720 RepID=UPI0026DC2A1F|nr:hypothetical protein [Corynebacterium sp.]MDO4762113.1 hypothetical protein [Corynebacterium sp.]
MKANNVWVVVDDGNDTTKDGGCVTKFDNGIEALKSAGFEITTKEHKQFGLILVGINGVVPNYDVDKTFWAYWYREVNEDLTINYEFAQLGASSNKPKPGSVEGWVVGDGKTKPSLAKVVKPADKSSSEKAVGPVAIVLGILALLGGIGAAIHAFLNNAMGNFKLPQLLTLF